MPSYDMGRPATPEEELALRQRIIEGISRLGPLGAHAKTVSTLDPKVASFDMITFQADYSAASPSVITGKTTTQRTPGGYLAELFAISAFMQKPGTNPEALPGILFNIKNQERPGDFFTTDLPFAAFVKTDGNGILKLPRGLYLFAPGSGIDVTWAVDTAIYTGLSAKRCGVMLHLNLWGVG